RRDQLGVGAAADALISGPLDTGGAVGQRDRAEAAQDLDANDLGVLGQTVLGAGEGASAVGAVAVVVLRGRTRVVEVGAELDAAGELVVVAVDTSVDDVRLHALASAVVVVVGLS